MRTPLKQYKKEGPTIAVGDVVIVIDDKVKRYSYSWKLAVVEQIIEGKDGHV